MSIKYDIDKLDDSSRDIINNELRIQTGSNNYLFPYNVVNDDIYLPFSFGANKLGLKRPKRDIFPTMNAKFEGTLREEQKDVKKEALDILSETGSVIISMYTGGGKCLGYDTPVLMYDGTIKMVQDIKIGEQIMGDDSTSRNILSVTTGTEQMYKIILSETEYFTCNESHILSLKIVDYKTLTIKDDMWRVKYFDKNKLKIVSKYFTDYEAANEFYFEKEADNIIDITVKEYMSLNCELRDYIKLYKAYIDFSPKEIDMDPYYLGFYLGYKTSLLQIYKTESYKVVEYLKNICKDTKSFGMYQFNKGIYEFMINNDSPLGRYIGKYKLFYNKHIPYNYKCNSEQIRYKVLAGIIDSCGIFQNNMFKLTINDKNLAEDIIYLSRSLGLISSKYKNDNKYTIKIFGFNLSKIPVLSENFIITHEYCNDHVYSFKVEPIFYTNRYYGFTIDGNRRFVLGDFTVTHNTITSINLAAQIKLKTLIIVNKIVLMQQWKDSILSVCPSANVEKITTKSTLDKDVDFLIINAINVPKMGANFFKHIGLVIVDELHLIMAEGLSKSLQIVSPRYLIGLSATPYREDGLDNLIELFFGKNKIIREMNREHIVYKVETGITIENEISESTGKVNWGAVLKQQCLNTERNDLIVKIIQFFKDRTFIVLCKRVEQAKYIYQELKDKGEYVDNLIGSKQEFDRNCRCLVSIQTKTGTGFDWPKVNTLLLATDTASYFIQSLGRIFREKDTIPIVFDIVDNNFILLKHYKERKQVYDKVGGKIVSFNRKYPDFF